MCASVRGGAERCRLDVLGDDEDARLFTGPRSNAIPVASPVADLAGHDLLQRDVLPSLPGHLGEQGVSHRRQGRASQRLVPLLAGEVNEGTYRHALPRDLAVARDALAGMFKIGEGA
jgi:hypothetical protein